MIVSAAIFSKSSRIYMPNYIPSEVKNDITKHVNTFLYTLEIEDDDVELPYVETTYLRYVYKQSDDLYWLLVTKTDSNLLSDVTLLGRFVSTIMEYGLSETNSGTLTDVQKDMFYRHIWRPWDESPRCSICGRNNNQAEIWEREFDSRLQFLISIRDGHVDESDVHYFDGLITESWTISAKLAYAYSSDNDSACSNETGSISEETVIEGCRLACQLEDMRIETKRIQDPYLRLFAKRNLLNGSDFNQQAPIGSAPSFDEFDSTSH